MSDFPSWPFLTRLTCSRRHFGSSHFAPRRVLHLTGISVEPVERHDHMIMYDALTRYMHKKFHYMPGNRWRRDFVMARRILSSALWSSASLLSRPSRRGISMGDAARNPRAAATPTPLRARLQAHYGRDRHFPRVQADHMFALVEVLSLPI